jgi:hypothetical protein
MVQFGDIIQGEAVNEISYFNRRKISHATSKSTYYVVPVLKDHIEAVKGVILTWEQRNKEAKSDKDKINTQSHIDYNKDLLKRETEIYKTLTKGK